MANFSDAAHHGFNPSQRPWCCGSFAKLTADKINVFYLIKRCGLPIPFHSGVMRCWHDADMMTHPELSLARYLMCQMINPPQPGMNP